jgi:hypothetical protein
MDNLNASAIDAVSAELAAKLSDAVGVGAAMSLAAQTAKVAGVAGGLVYIAAGSATGVKPGQRFQVVHMADTGLVNPDTNQHIMTKQNVCIFVVVNVVDDSNSSGSCDGGLPKSGDIAQRIP